MHWKLLLTGAALCAPLALTGCGESSDSSSGSGLPVVGIVQLVEHPALDAANRGIVDALKARGVEIRIDQQNAQADQSNLRTIAQRFLSQDAKLIFAIATPAAQTMANATSKIPIVATAVTNYEIARLVKSEKKPGTNVTGSSDLNPVEKQLDLILELVPGAKTVGTVYNSSEINSQYQVKILRDAAARRGVQVLEAAVSTVNDVQQAVQSLAGRIQALYVPTDNVMASAMPVLSRITMPAKIPVVTGEVGAMTAGDGLGTVGVDYYELGRIAGEMGADILSGKSTPAEMPVRHQENFRTTVNERVAEALGVKLSDELRARAQLIR